jgi:hypothetical protein
LENYFADSKSSQRSRLAARQAFDLTLIQPEFFPERYGCSTSFKTVPRVPCFDRSEELLRVGELIGIAKRVVVGRVENVAQDVFALDGVAL